VLLDGAAGPPVTVSGGPERDLEQWAAEHQSELTELLHTHGAVLFRGWPVASPMEFRNAVASMWRAPWAEYREPGTPRTAVIDNVATSTEYDAASEIHPHNENSHVSTWPERLFFWCQQAAAHGGETPIADVREVLARVPPETRSRAREQGIIYQRSFGYGLGFRWQDVFATEDRLVAEDYFRRSDMTWTWDGPRLRVRYHRKAITAHPSTHEEVWFNHGVIYSPYALQDEQRAFVDEFGIDRMPFSTYWGDGTPISQDEVDTLLGCYRACARTFSWEPGDVLMLDNMLVAHGRRAYAGSRRVLVAMRGTVSASGRVGDQDDGRATSDQPSAPDERLSDHGGQSSV
jgi:alpha-ketoglutarate-dependent taurine dioxygenase